MTKPANKQALLALTRGLPDGAFFAERSREKELEYIERSFGRWTEVIGVARARLDSPERMSCLDIGASPFTFLLQGVFGRVATLDLTDGLRERCEAAGIVHVDGGVDSPAAISRLEKVDCVFFLEVLEHLHADPVEVLRGIRSVLRPGGLLLLSTPNMMCLANRVLMLTNRKLHHFDYPPFSRYDRNHGNRHDRIYMPAELVEYFGFSGFQEVEVLYQIKTEEIHKPRNRVRRGITAGLSLLKRAVPSLGDGILVVGRNPRS